MNTELKQSLTIELNTKGRNTIPIIYPENIITIHGKNGVGKSMAATLLEIASGNYTFENKNRFEKLANIIESCEINFKNNGNKLYKIILKPYLWKFDENLNRVNPLTLGKFFVLEQEREKEIDFNEFIKNIYIRTIRGNESLHQQIYFFKDLFVAKIEQKLKKLENINDFLERYQKWLNENANEELINNYYQLQEIYKGQLNEMDNLQNNIRNREANLEILQRKLDLLRKLTFISSNDKGALIKNKEEEEKRIEATQKEIESNYKESSNIKLKLDELKSQFDENTNLIIKKLKKFKNKEEKLKSQLDSQSKLNLENLDEAINKKEIEDKIKFNQDEITKYKKDIENLNKENERIIEINKYLTQLRDTCSKASSYDFGKEKLIKISNSGDSSLSISFEELFEIFNKNNIFFKQDKDLKEYKNKVEAYNENIKLNSKILDILKEYAKVQGKIRQLEKKVNGKGLKLDSFVDLEVKINSLEQKQQDRKKNIEILEKDVLDYKNRFGQFEKIIKDIEEYPSQTALLNNLNKLGLKIDQTKPILENCNIETAKIEEEIKKESNELTLMNHRKNETEKNIEKSKNDLEPVSEEIRKAAKKFGYNQMGEFLDYFKIHNDKLKKYLENTKNLYTRFNTLKNDITNVLEGVKPKNKAHLEIINAHFDNIFKKLYGKKEFFEYVFKDYSKIKQFDIVNKSIIFETHGGLEETRDLDEFSSGEKTYAYCRSIISMTAGLAKFNIVILDESYALLDHEHSQDLYQFQEQMVQQKGITKFINILPLKEDLNGLTAIVEKNLQEEKKRGESSNLRFLESQLNILQTFQKEVSTHGYYQEIHFPKEKRRTLNINFGAGQNFGEVNPNYNLLDENQEKLEYSFILDGSNIARSNRNSKDKPSIRDVIRCKEEIQKMGVPEKNIFIVFGAGLWHYLDEREKEIYKSLFERKTACQAPAGRDDDWVIIDFAIKNNSYIITNDMYKQYKVKYPQYEDFIDIHSIRYSILGNDIIFEEGFTEKLKMIIKKKGSM